MTCEPVVAILVPSAAISCEVVPLVVLKVGLLKPVMVSGQCPHAARPRPLDDQVPAVPPSCWARKIQCTWNALIVDVV